MQYVSKSPKAAARNTENILFTTDNRKIITVLAMAGAFIFVISSLKIPSVTGSCSHIAIEKYAKNTFRFVFTPGHRS